MFKRLLKPISLFSKSEKKFYSTVITMSPPKFPFARPQGTEPAVEYAQVCGKDFRPLRWKSGIRSFTTSSRQLEHCFLGAKYNSNNLMLTPCFL